MSKDDFHKKSNLENAKPEAIGPSISPQEITRHQALEIAIRYHQAGNLAQAKDLYEKILQAEPQQPIALHLLGVLAHQKGRQDIALKLITKAIEIKPDYDEAHNNLGTVLKSLGRLQDAVTHYQLSIKLKPEAADPYYNVATAYEKLDLEDEAIAYYLRSIELNPRFAAAHFNLGNVYRRLGKFDDAVAHFRNAISIIPDYAEAYRVIARIKEHSAYDDDIKAMESLISQPTVSEQKKMHLAFGLGKAFEDLGNNQRTFEFIERGNVIKRQSFDLKIKNWDRYIERQMAVFTPALFERHRDAGCSDHTAVFILGMPRSGTSLVEQILASHADVHAAGEVRTLGDIIEAAFDIATFPENVLQAKSESFKQPGERYIELMRQHATRATRITNKTPDNFKIIGMIKLILPNAKIVHCQRNPMDNCWSLYKNYFSRNDQKYSYDQVELGLYYKGYLKLMKHWHRVLPGFIYDIQYEKIIAEQEPQTRALLEFCGLDWDDACLKFYQTERVVKTASAAQVRRPVYKSSVESWKRYEKQLSPLYRCLFESD
ncbi:MAG: sulfotransferase [Pseudomonadales bacterium]